LRSIGLKPSFKQNASRADLEAEIKAGRPVAVGWLHKGPFSKPSGGGHWSVVVGQDKGVTIHHDPFGTCDLVKGDYKSANGGKFIRYSDAHWMPRWCVASPNDGWAMFVKV
jgi:hypothetical protein